MRCAPCVQSPRFGEAPDGRRDTRDRVVAVGRVGRHDRDERGRPGRRRLGRAALALALLGSPARADPLFLQTVDVIESEPQGWQDRFHEPLIDASGRVVYSRVTVFGSTGVGIWVGERTAAPLVRAGDAAPGVPDARFASIGDPVSDGAGGVAFLAALEVGSGGVTSANNVGLWAADAAGALRLGAREGDQAPGLPVGARFERIQPPALSAAGVLAFEADLARFFGGVNLDNFRTLWISDASGTRLLARSGSQAPGQPPGTTFTFFGTPILNRVGELAFRAGLSGPSAATLWGPGPTGELEVALRSGMPAPAPAAGTFLWALGTPDLNDAGELVLHATLEIGRGSVTSSNDQVLLRVSRARRVELLAREGAQAPGVPSGAVYHSLIGHVTSHSGAVVFWGNLRLGAGGVDVTNDIGLWLAERDAAPVLLFRRGQALPGLGLRFEGPAWLALNTAGDLVCLCSVADASGQFAHAILRRTRDGALDMIARNGEPLTVAPGDVRRVSSLDFAGAISPEFGSPGGSGLNERGDVAFKATFFPGGHARILRATTSPPPRPPVADAGGSRVLECSSPEGARVALDGSASSDPDADELAFTWENSFGVRTGPTAEVVLALGEHAVTLTVEDPTGLSDTDQIEIAVVDATPPAIDAIRARPEILWPPNGRMIPVTVEVGAHDACDPAPRCRIVDVANSERPRRSSRAAARLTGDLSAELRAERSGHGPGRTYSLGVECADGSQNSARTEVEVRVPHHPAPRRGRGGR